MCRPSAYDGHTLAMLCDNRDTSSHERQHRMNDMTTERLQYGYGFMACASLRPRCITDVTTSQKQRRRRHSANPAAV